MSYVCGHCDARVDDPTTHKCAEDRRSWREWDEGRKHSPGIPMDATCMTCGCWTLCVRVVDIGWICLECHK